MKKIRTSVLVGPLLDWAVAQCMKLEIQIDTTGKILFDRQKHPDIVCDDIQGQWAVFSPSTLPGQGNQIIKRERIVLIHKDNGDWHAVKDTRIEDQRHWEQNRKANPKLHWRESPPEQSLFVGWARAQSVAAMRSYVAAKYGWEIGVPDDVLQLLMF
jgi:hypothetical protein